MLRILVLSFLLVACGPNDEAVVSIAAALAAVPTPTVPVQPTPPPTATPAPTATSQPTPTLVPTAMPPPVVEFSAVYPRILSSVFYLGNSTASGIGWLVKDGFLLTNEHVVTGYATTTVRQADPGSRHSPPPSLPMPNATSPC